MHIQFIEPVKNSADFIFDGTKDFSNALEEIYGLLINIDSNNQ